MIKPKIAWDIKIREIDNGLIVTVENQNNIVFHKLYCKDITEALDTVNKKLTEKATEG